MGIHHFEDASTVGIQQLYLFVCYVLSQTPLGIRVALIHVIGGKHYVNVDVAAV